MVGAFLSAVRDFLATSTPWVMIAPWEAGIRVRMGKKVKKYGAGLHFKIPFFDRWYTQSIRTRIADLGRQTLSTADGKVVTILGVVEYEIVDILKLYETLHHAEDTIVNYARSELIGRISQLDSDEVGSELSYEDLEYPLLERAGIKVGGIRLTDCAVVRTYRIIGDKDHYQSGDSLETDAWTN